MTTNTVFGREHPERGSALYLVVDGRSMPSAAGASSGNELVAEVPRSREGRRPRLALGAEIPVSWGWRGQVRTRVYRLADVVSGGAGRPCWRLEPVAGSTQGTRRAVPRIPIAVPAVLVTPTSRLSGETADLSVTGVRLVFPPATGAVPGPLPRPGDAGDVALLVDGTRVAVPVEVVCAQVLPGGDREVRLSLIGDVDGPRALLQDVIRAAEAALDDQLGRSQPKVVPVSAS